MARAATLQYYQDDHRPQKFTFSYSAYARCTRQLSVRPAHLQLSTEIANAAQASTSPQMHVYATTNLFGVAPATTRSGFQQVECWISVPGRCADFPIQPRAGRPSSRSTSNDPKGERMRHVGLRSVTSAQESPPAVGGSETMLESACICLSELMLFWDIACGISAPNAGCRKVFSAHHHQPWGKQITQKGDMRWGSRRM